MVFALTGLYNRIPRFTSLFDLFAIFKSVIISSILISLGILHFIGFEGYPKSVLLIYFILNSLGVCTSRIFVRIYFTHFKTNYFTRSKSNKKRLILIGAGTKGEKVAREIINSPDSPFEIICFLDNDKNKIGQKLHGFKVKSLNTDLRLIRSLYDELLICIPSKSGPIIRDVVEKCKRTGKKYKIVPSFNELMDRDLLLPNVRDVSYIDLLGRDEIKLDLNSIENMLNGKRILITGAGGSIGSELVRQCINFAPSEIICVDLSEEKIFDLGLNNQNNNHNLIISPVLCNINNYTELEKVYNDNRPQIVLHAAAYKHVPIQELSPWTAVNTNVGGTLNMINLSDKFLVEKFVLVSTDKAVNPVNIMGATKRVAEKIIQSKNLISKTKYMAVRFGNVLGSSGSAIPIFQNQINAGGPVTITHPEMTRYFMSIQEASQLIIQCGSQGNDGEIFLLEMGKALKIDNIARDLIKLSGFKPEKDIPIVYSGLRPGEKLYEELQHSGEIKMKTNHKKIMVLKDDSIVMAWEEINRLVSNLLITVKSLDGDKIQKELMNLVPTYTPRKYSPNPKKHLSSYSIKGEA